ncbi:MAG TPA: hypothetical protein VIK18_18180 [Pirellulales bacterium]
MPEPIRMLVENRGEVLIVEGIFRDLVSRGDITVDMAWVSSSVISLAELSLLRKPLQPVVVALNCPEQQSEQLRNSVERILSNVSPGGPWHVAIAVPDMRTWIEAELNFTATLARSGLPGRPSKIDLAVFFKDWASQNHFGRDQAATNNSEFAALARFIAHQLALSAGVA